MKKTQVERLYAKLNAALAKVAETDTPEADRGSLKRKATPGQRLAYRICRRHREAADSLASKIISTPAAGLSDMMLKIRALGILIDPTFDPSSDTDRLDDWQPEVTGYVFNDAAPLLVTQLRSDIQNFLAGRADPNAT